MKTTWTSPADLDAAPPVRQEFPPDVAQAMSELRRRGGLAPTPEDVDAQREDLHHQHAGVNRRGFLHLTGAAAVLAVVAGCGKKPHPDTLVAYNQQPEGVTLGEGVFYSTTVRVNGSARPVMARVYDGRPIKLEGNPDHPRAAGKSDAATQAALLDLYDPDRGGCDLDRPGTYHDGPRQRVGEAWTSCTWTDLDAAVATAMGSGLIGLITGPVDGPGSRAFIARLRQLLGERLVHAAYHPWAEDAAVEARRRVLGRATVGVPQLAEAQVVVCLGSDLLGHASIATQVDFGRFRKRPLPGQLIAIEPTLSQTGTVADLRLRAGMGELPWIAWAIAAEIARLKRIELPPAIAQALAGAAAPSLRPVRTQHGDLAAIPYIAERLLAAQGAGLVYVGGPTHAGPESLDLHVAATWINQALGHEGRTIVDGQPAAGQAAVRALLDQELATLIVAGADPAFALPGAAARIARVPCVVSLNAGRDDTTALAHWHAPGQHDLESWGDAASGPGLAEIRQPLIQPLWNSRAAEQSLIAFAVAALGEHAPADFRTARVAAPAVGYPVSVVTRVQLWDAAERGIRPWSDWLRQHWIEAVQPATGSAATGDAFWRAVLARGFVTVPAEPTASSAPQAITAPAAPASGMRLVCTAARTIGDGSQLNNAWLQEVPDPVSKIVWDGYAAVSPMDAKAAGIAANDVLDVTVGDQVLRLPAHIQDGQHPGTVEVFLGWGRTQAGVVAGITAEDGYRANPYLLPARHGLAVTLRRTGATYVLANTQGHHRMEGRPLALDMVLGQDPQRVHHAHWVNGTDGKEGGRLSLWRTSHQYNGKHWGMAIDLDACTGCGACMVACSAENNVPVVGRDEVRKNREMHWIRVDRYYLGDAESRLDVEAVHQPMLCQQCDHAPCEAVCPANATVHSDEGINIQIYNRCIGTRYCSNNCPYKVRRFNWYQYSSFRAGPHRSEEPLGRLAKNVVTEGSDAAPAELAHAPLNLLLNPEITVRHRGVMEKCNFCVQRQRQWKDAERVRKTPQVTSACAQACPTAAIVWGDLNDAAGVVAQAGSDPRAHLVLDAEYNTRPKVAYLRKVRNRPANPDDQTTEGHG